MFCTLRYTSGSWWAAQPPPHKGAIIPGPVSGAAALAGLDTALITHYMMKSTQTDETMQLCWHGPVEKRVATLCVSACGCVFVSVCTYMNVYFHVNAGICSPAWLLSA